MVSLSGRVGAVVVGVIVLSVLAAVAPGVVDGASPAGEEVETDNTVTRIEVHADGSARWQVRIRTRLRTDAAIRTYEAFQERFRANRSRYRSGFRASMEGIVAEAERETGRSMRASNVTVETSIRTVPRRWGIVTYAYTWEGFARTDGERLTVGDAFQSGFFIAPNDTLQLRAPAGYDFSTVEPTPDEVDGRLAIWEGRVDFGDGQPAATMRPAAEPGGGGLVVPLAVGVLAVLLGSVGFIGYRRVRDETTTPASTSADQSTSAQTTSTPVTDEERLRELLQSNGGRMRQADIVDHVEWSESKVSRRLDRLVEEDVVEKTRIGRENVVSLTQSDEESDH